MMDVRTSIVDVRVNMLVFFSCSHSDGEILLTTGHSGARGVDVS